MELSPISVNFPFTHLTKARSVGLFSNSIGFGTGGAGGRPPPTFWPRGGAKGGAHHFELQPLVCIVCSGKVVTLTQQCIKQVTKVTTNTQQDP